MRQFVKRDNWNEYLKLASLSYNTSFHKGTCFIPYEFVFGKIAELPSSESPLNHIANETYQ